MKTQGTAKRVHGLINESDAARLLGVNPETLARARRGERPPLECGPIKFARIAGHIKYEVEEVARAKKACTVGA